MITGFISAFAPPTQNGRPGGGGKRFKRFQPNGRRPPYSARQKRVWAMIRNRAHRLLCWMLAVLATKLANATYALTRFGVLNRPQTAWLLRFATRLHAKSVRMLMGGLW